ncbi:hypothetical protein ACLKA7_001253 [Drosophila subpalustris]
MAQGLRMSWKQPIYFDFDTPMTVTILYKLIEKLYMVGYHVVGIVNDLGPGNHKLWTNLGVSPAELLKYVEDRYDMKYLITSRISQDQLEHFFGAMRSKGGLHDHPTPLEFKFRLRKYLIARNTEILDTRANIEVEPVPWLDIDIASMQSSSSSSAPANLAKADEAGENAIGIGLYR